MTITVRRRASGDALINVQVGVSGRGVPPGGALGQALVKASGDDFDTQWATVSSGGGDGGDGASWLPIEITDVTGLTEALGDKASETDLASEATTRGEADTLLAAAAAALDDRLGTAEAKLSGIAPGATANATDDALRARSSHTGTQEIETITGLAALLIAFQNRLAALETGGTMPPPEPIGGALNFSLSINSALIGAI